MTKKNITTRFSLPQWFVIYSILLFVLNLLDGFGTIWHLRHGATELNPVMTAVLNNFGECGFIIVKSMIIILLLFVTVFCILKVKEVESKLIKRCLRILTAAYAGVVTYQGFMLAVILNSRY